MLKCLCLCFRIHKGKLLQQKKKLNQQEEREEEEMFKGMHSFCELYPVKIKLQITKHIHIPSFPFLLDEVPFGEVAMAPPSLSVKPKKAIVKPQVTCLCDSTPF